MNIRVLILIQILFLSSCITSESETAINSKLIGAKSYYVGEPTDPESQKYEQLADERKVEISTNDHFIIVKTWYIVNACGNCKANLEIRNDTIELVYEETAEELCSSQSIEEVIYFIDNPDNKSWVILK